MPPGLPCQQNRRKIFDGQQLKRTTQTLYVFMLKKFFAKDKTDLQIALEKLAGNDRQAVIKAAVQLGRTGSPQAIDALLARLDDTDEKVRSACAEALGNLADPHHPAILAPLVDCLNDPCEEVRFSATEALAKTRAEEVLAPIITVLKQDSNPFVRDSAANALAGFAYEESITALINALTDTNEMVRSTAAVSLNTLIVPDLVNKVVKNAMLPLIQALKSINHTGRTAAAEALGKIGDPRAIKHLNRLLEDSKSEVQAAAREAIDNINALIEYERMRELMAKKSAPKSAPDREHPTH